MSPPKTLESPKHSSFRKGVFWNIGSFTLMGISGVLLNIVIAQFYPASTLGVFNQVFAIYIFVSQLAVFGIHYSILHFGSILVDQDAKSASEGASTAIFLVAGISLLVTAILGSLHTTVGALLKSPDVSTGILAILPGLLFFPLNKVLMAILNSHRRMQAYAIANSSRYLLLIFGVFIMAVLSVSGKYLSAAFSLGESILFAALLWCTREARGKLNLATFRYWLGTHMHFGSRIMLAGLLAELNTRIDILILGYYMSDASVGIYSFVAILAEGFLQLLTVLRVNYDPLLAKLYATQDWETLSKTIKKGRKLAYFGMITAGCLGIVLYPFVMQMLGFSAEYIEAGKVLAILLVGIMASAGYMPFSGMLQQAGFPSSQSLLILAVALINLIGNILLVPVLGLVGAATATAIAQAAFAVLLVLMVRQKLKFQL